MENIKVIMLANSYAHTFKSWGGTPKWAQDRAMMLIAAINNSESLIRGIGYAVAEDDGSVEVTLYTSEYWKDNWS